jgi:transcription termination factor Rho
VFPALNIEKNDTRKGELLDHPEEINNEKQNFQLQPRKQKQINKIIVPQTSSTQNGRSWRMKCIPLIE